MQKEDGSWHRCLRTVVDSSRHAFREECGTMRYPSRYAWQLHGLHTFCDRPTAVLSSPCDCIDQKKRGVHKISARNSGARNGCANFMGAWHFLVLSAGNHHAHKIPPFRGGSGFF